MFKVSATSAECRRLQKLVIGLKNM